MNIPNLCIIIYLILHLILCLIIYIGIRLRFFKFSEQIMPIIVFIPFFGVVIAIIADFYSRRRKTGSKKFSLEEMALDDGDVRMIHVQETLSDDVIPLEEAMSINDAETRRSLMLKILREDPNKYILLLKKARFDNDIEVTHYASTAIMEVQREYELSLQKHEKAYKENPEDAKALDDYIDIMNRYINSGLVDENILFIHRKRFLELLNDKISGGNENIDIYIMAADTNLELDNLGEASYLADQMIRKWPENEKAWFTKLKVCQKSNDGPAIKNVIAEIKKRNLYLSPEGRDILRFWDGGTSSDK